MIPLHQLPNAGVSFICPTCKNIMFVEKLNTDTWEVETYCTTNGCKERAVKYKAKLPMIAAERVFKLEVANG